MNDKYESEIARLELANSGLRSINAGICVELAAAKAEVTRLTEKYDFQRLVKSEESLKAEVERLTEHNCVGEKSFTEYWCSGLGPLSARKVWPQKSDELKHLHTWLTAWSFSNADRDRYKALCQKMAEALRWAVQSMNPPFEWQPFVKANELLKEYDEMGEE